MDPYDLPIRSAAIRRNTTAWISLGLISLVLAGVFSLLLVFARTPIIQERIPFVDFFHVALVVHVTLSVLVWLLAISAATWSLSTSTEHPWWDQLSFSLAALGTAIIVVCPFTGAGDPLMNNYVPVLRHPLFYVGLGLFGVGILSHLVRTLVSRPRLRRHLDGIVALRAGIVISAVVTGLAFVAVGASWLGLPGTMDGQILSSRTRCKCLGRAGPRHRRICRWCRRRCDVDSDRNCGCPQLAGRTNTACADKIARFVQKSTGATLR